MCSSGMLYNCGICCLLLSIWGVVQLIIMGIFYKIEASPLIEDVEADEYIDYDDFIKKTKKNYEQTAINCWIAAVIYAVTAGISVMCIMSAKNKAKRLAAELEDDELFCVPPDEPGQPKKKKA